MTVRIIETRDKYIVEWVTGDQYFHTRTFYYLPAAERYAAQLECRLMLDTMLDAGTYGINHTAGPN